MMPGSLRRNPSSVTARALRSSVDLWSVVMDEIITINDPYMRLSAARNPRNSTERATIAPALMRGLSVQRGGS